MADRLMKIIGIGSIFLAMPVAAFAFQPIPVPEPATLTLVAAGLGVGATVYVVKKWMRPK
jgi:hypothetical protein